MAPSRLEPFRRWLSDPTVLALSRLLLGLVFLFASSSKIAHTQAFAATVRSYRILPVEITNLFAIGLAWSEALAGALLLLGLAARAAAGAVSILLGLFVIALTATLVRGMVIDCGCFGSDGGHPVDWSLLVRDLLMLVLALAIARWGAGRFSLDGALRSRER
jgi:uncharacterized membrane protein YphA (DoxX/SURF4 family)